MKGENIALRLRQFSVGVIRAAATMPETSAAKHINRQLVRAATSSGANYEEARGSESRADFIHKLGIAMKEMREALYWIHVASEAGLFSSLVDPLVREANELVAILTASIRTAKENERES